MKALPNLVEATPEGRILAALVDRERSYTELRLSTGLSDRWLSRKLGELSHARIIGRRGNLYRIEDVSRVMESDPLFAEYVHGRLSLEAKARLAAENLSHNEKVIAVVLFGSVAKREESPESDIDLLIVTEDKVEEELNAPIYDLMIRLDVPIEAVSLTYEEMVMNLHEMTAFAFGILEGYEVLYDRGGLEELLSIKRRRMVDEWVYEEEAGAWIQKRLLHISKQRKSS